MRLLDARQLQKPFGTTVATDLGTDRKCVLQVSCFLLVNCSIAVPGVLVSGASIPSSEAPSVLLNNFVVNKHAIFIGD